MKKRWLALLLALSLLLSGCVIEISVPQETVPGEGLTIHFIDVGQADCALLACDGEYMLIDGGNRDDGQLVVSYLQQQGVEELKAVVCTHAHEDHVGGLPSVLAVYPTQAVYAPTNTYASKVFDSFLYYTDQQRLSVTIPAPGDELTLGGATLTVLGPVKSYPDANNTSIVLKAVYGNTSFLFTGDMETQAETDMLDYWEGRMDFDCDVLKVGHHGSSTSTSYRLLHEVTPAHGVISVGEGNDYGHPHKEPLSRLKQAGVVLLRTDQLGHVIAESDGETISFTWENQNAQPEDVIPADSRFIGNKNSKKFHAPGCANLPTEKNQVIFDSYQAAIDAGYSPCGSCLG